MAARIGVCDWGLTSLCQQLLGKSGLHVVRYRNRNSNATAHGWIRTASGRGGVGGACDIWKEVSWQGAKRTTDLDDDGEERVVCAVGGEDHGREEHVHVWGQKGERRPSLRNKSTV